MSHLIQDLRYGLRQVQRNPGLTLAAVVSLALGIGANTAAFSFVNALFLRPLPVEEPERLVRLYSSYTHGFRWGEVSVPAYRAYAASGAFSGVVAEGFAPLSLKEGTGSERVLGALVSANYFEVLGVRAVLGRTFGSGEGRAPGADPVVVLSHGSWKRRWGGDPHVIGRTLVLNRHPFTVVGVAPPGYTGTMVGLVPDLWAPLTMQAQLAPGPDWLESHRIRRMWALGRLGPGVDLAQARSAAAAVAAQLAQERPDDYANAAGATVIPEAEGGFHPFYRRPFMGFLGVMMGAVGLVLLIACANVASLLLARATGRSREIGIRRAMGASSLRLVRQLLTEGALLAAAAAGAGLLLAEVGLDLLTSLQPPMDVPLSFVLAADGRVLGFTLAVSLAACLFFGLAPAHYAARLDVVDALGGRASSQHAARSPFRSGLVAGQIALSLTLLVCTGLFVRSLQNASTIDLGFEPDGVALATLDPGLEGYDEASSRALHDELLQRLASRPDVESAALARALPFGLDPYRTGIRPEGDEPPEGQGLPLADFNAVSEGYFETLRIPLLAGRSFEARDRVDSARVAIVNQALARRHWPGVTPIGRRFEALGERWQIVGVVRDARYATLGEERRAFFYLHFRQVYRPEMTLHVRSAGGVAGGLAAVREETRALDAALPLFGTRPMTAAIATALLPARLGASVLGLFGVLALVLTSVGLYGLLAYVVGCRRAEIGVRMALGATPRDILARVMRQGLSLAGIGLAAGVALTLAATRLLESFLYGVSRDDPLAFAAGCFVIALLSCLGCGLPALRASRVSPAAALRHE